MQQLENSPTIRQVVDVMAPSFNDLTFHHEDGWLSTFLSDVGAHRIVFCITDQFQNQAAEKSTQISEKTRTYCITLTLDQEYIGHIGGNKSTFSIEDQIEVTLNGLSDEYDGFITSIVS